MEGGFLDEEFDHNVMNEINMTPLVDIMLVLLIIFIVTVPVMSHAVRINLPRASAQAAPIEPQVVQLSVDATGAYFWNDEAIGDSELIQRLARESQRTPQPELSVRGDSQVRYERVAVALAYAQQAGLTKIGFVTQAPDR